VRSLVRPAEEKRKHGGASDARPGSVEFLRRLRSKNGAGAGAQGRWTLIQQRILTEASATEWTASIAQQLLVRNGIVMRETGVAENIPGGYSTLYPALKTMEDSGWARRGMFVAGMGAAQFALSSAVDMLRSLRHEPEFPEAVHLAATDPANPYGGLLPWPRLPEESTSLSRTSGASVVLINGQLTAFLRRRNPAIRVFLPENDPEKTQFARELARKLAAVALQRQSKRQGLLIGSINEQPAREHLLARFLEEAGFVSTALGFQMRRVAQPANAVEPDEEIAEDALSENV
jgi:ATP-dependent Lhr-like helicase